MCFPRYNGVRIQIFLDAAYNYSMAESEIVIFRSGEYMLQGALHAPRHAPSFFVVISHGFAGYGDSPKWRFLASGLARAGFPALRFSHRGCGGSEGDFADTTLSGRVADLRAAMEFIGENYGARAFGLVGSSFGGVTALVCAADPGVRCVVTMGTPADFDFFYDIFPEAHSDESGMLEVDGMRVKRGIIDDAARYNIAARAAAAPRLCVLHGECDELLPVRHAEKIFNAASEPRHLEILPGADHAFSDLNHQNILLQRCIHWFQRYLDV